MNTNILTQIITIVAVETEISIDNILSKNKQADVVDARCIFVYHCFKFGIPSIAIARFLSRRRKCVITNYINNYHCYSKQSLSFRLMSKQVYDKLVEIYPELDYKL